MRKLRALLQAVIRKVQWALMGVLLFFLYVVGFGATFLFATVFNRRLLKAPRGGEGTSWVGAEGYDPDMDDAVRQT